MIGIETDVLVRYIVQDDARQASIATRFIETTLDTANRGFITVIAFCELVWVLESGYGYAREQVADTLQRMFEVGRFHLETPALAWRALGAYRGGVDFSDALLALIGEQAGCDYTASFELRAARLKQVRSLLR